MLIVGSWLVECIGVKRGEKRKSRKQLVLIQTGDLAPVSSVRQKAHNAPGTSLLSTSQSCTEIV